MTTNSTGYYSSYGSGYSTYGGYGNQQQTSTAGSQGYSTTSSAQSSPIDRIAVDEHARIWGDPHIDDADGGKYDFQERGIYNLLNDQGVNVNVRTDGPEGGPTYVTEAGLMVDGQQVNVAANGTVTVGAGADAYELQNGETRQLSDGSYITKQGDKVTVGTPEYKMEFSTNKEHKGTQYMDIDIYTRDGGVALDGRTPTGLLGETFDADDTAQEGTKKDAAAYQRNSMYEGGEPAAPPNQPFPAPYPPPSTEIPPAPVTPPVTPPPPYPLPPGSEIPPAPPGSEIPPAPVTPPVTPPPTTPAPAPAPAPGPAPAPPANSQMQQLMMMFVQMIQLMMQMLMGGNAASGANQQQ